MGEIRMACILRDSPSRFTTLGELVELSAGGRHSLASLCIHHSSFQRYLRPKGRKILLLKLDSGWNVKGVSWAIEQGAVVWGIGKREEPNQGQTRFYGEPKTWGEVRFLMAKARVGRERFFE